MENSKNIKISIIIPSWNTDKITLKCVETILKHIPLRYIEIIIVDNGSTDDTEQIFSNKPNIIYVRNSANLGFSKANNIGADISSGDYLFFLNSDMELIDNSLLSMAEFIKENNRIGIIGPKFLNPDLTEQGSIIPEQNIVNAIKEYWFGQKAYSKYSLATNKPSKVDNISGGAVLISKSNFNKVGGWDERYFFYYEDLELCRQIKKIGKEVFYFPGCQVIHRHGASGAKVAPSVNQWRRLIPSSKLYHGIIKHYLIFLIIWSGQKIFKILNSKN